MSPVHVTLFLKALRLPSPTFVETLGLGVKRTNWDTEFTLSTTVVHSARPLRPLAVGGRQCWHHPESPKAGGASGLTA